MVVELSFLLERKDDVEETLSERRSNSDGAEEKWLLVVLMILGMFAGKVYVVDEGSGNWRKEGMCVVTGNEGKRIKEK